MKVSVLFLLFSILSLNVYGQKSSAWLPEKYIQAISKRDTLAYKFLMPVSGFMYDDRGRLMVLTYGGEITRVKTKEVTFKGQKKLQLSVLFFNLKYVPEEMANMFSGSTFYYSKSGEKIRLETIHVDNTQEIFFVDHDGAYKFKNIRESLMNIEDKYNIHNGPQPIIIGR